MGNLYIPKPVPIEARQMPKSYHRNMTALAQEIYSWVEELNGGSYDCFGNVPERGVTIDPGSGYMLIKLPHVEVEVKPGDWICRVNNDFKVVSDEAFRMLFQEFVDA